MVGIRGFAVKIPPRGQNHDRENLGSWPRANVTKKAENVETVQFSAHDTVKYQIPVQKLQRTIFTNINLRFAGLAVHLRVKRTGVDKKVIGTTWLISLDVLLASQNTTLFS